jgi:hypothetical protein
MLSLGQEDGQANGGAVPESVFGCVSDPHQGSYRRGNSTSADTLVRVTGGNPATAGVEYFSLPAPGNSGNWKLIERTGSYKELIGVPIGSRKGFVK